MQTIYVIDDDRIMRNFLAKTLGALGWKVATYESAEALLDDAPIEGPGCLIVDVQLPGMNGIEFLHARPPALKRLPVIVITGFGEVSVAVKAMQAGAVDFIEKPVTIDQLRTAVCHASQSVQQSSENRPDLVAAELISSLTMRQQEILALVLDGNTNKGIAANLGISQRTVEAHRAAIMRRLGATTVAELIRIVLVGISLWRSSDNP